MISMNDGCRTVIVRRQSVHAWLLASFYIFYAFGSFVVSCAAGYRLIHDFRVHVPFRGGVFLAGLVFGWKSWLLGRWLYRMLMAYSVLTVRGDTLTVCCGTRFQLHDFGTYAAANLTELTVEGGNNLLPAGKVQVLIGGVPLVLADCMSESDGSHLVDLLCDAYPFRTPDPTPSSAVVHW